MLETKKIDYLNKDVFLNKKVLVAEDHIIASLAVNEILESLGCEVTNVRNGIQAIQSINRQSYDLLILDWNMPNGNGLDVINYISHSIGTELPFIIYSEMSPFKVNISNTNKINLLDFWKKSISTDLLLEKIIITLNRIG